MRPVTEICIYRASQLARLLGASTTVPLCWLNTASCSWYAWNSHRLKQTQAGNKQPCSFLSSPPPSSSNFSQQSSSFEGITRLSLLLKPHCLVVEASLTSDQQHPLHSYFLFFSPFSGGQDILHLDQAV